MDDEDKAFWRMIAKAVFAAVAVVVLIIGLAMWGMPKYKLYKADIEKKTLVSTARAKAEAAEHTAKAEVTKANYQAERDRIRAQGTADANRLIGESLTSEFLTWYYVDTISGGNDQIIYVPTEGGLPLLEAGRLTQGEETGQ